jgi:hypothetical protein
VTPGKELVALGADLGVSPADLPTFHAKWQWTPMGDSDILRIAWTAEQSRLTDTRSSPE